MGVRRSLALVLFSVFSAAAQTTELDAFVGRDLWENPLPPGEQQRLNRIVGEIPKSGMLDPAPRYVWKTTRNAARYVVFLSGRIVTIPGSTSACVFLFDGCLARLETWCFNVGWRIHLRSASFEFSASLGSEALVLHTEPATGGRDVAKQYFTLSHDGLRFIRMENEKGEAVQNEYVYPSVAVGLVPRGKRAREWIEMLRSPVKPEVLSALVFLGGRHMDEDRAPGPHARLFQRLMGNRHIRELISGLSHSDDEWIRQAALLAARDPHDRQPEDDR